MSSRSTEKAIAADASSNAVHVTINSNTRRAVPIQRVRTIVI
jgi:hypothetical protein